MKKEIKEKKKKEFRNSAIALSLSHANTHKSVHKYMYFRFLCKICIKKRKKKK